MFLLINKPEGWTSFDVVNYIRKQIKQSPTYKLKTKNSKLKVGHAGTLDPFATGLLIIGVGRENTKKLDKFKNLPKTYIATLKLGFVSDTFDKTGKISNYQLSIFNKFSILQFLKKTFKTKTVNPDYLYVNKILQKFLGKQKQLPPMFSAKKIKGQKLYDLARKGIIIKRKKCKIEIYNIELLEYNYPKLKIKINCSSGTYIRTLAHDIGKKLGVGAYCEDLVRTKIGEYSLAQAQDIKTVYPQ
ncbi:MAG TPA: tRNA pseudouridine(55) synthase [Candidatus Magasanikbacteria bacterium]|jgi:tRNA pseudouridine55 synthase|nr:tRNA pseudouridine(55) synthase [Candidatus Magasanikbacteria bacterium]HQF57517.1 tRNA pseudouridine(55) synthase [Candidatus Magasanikbacteria bacterium]HQL52374.1 tRNA pseudouridine(55) synthase [Candidatus Magasanikbacteria bacterium]